VKPLRHLCAALLFGAMTTAVVGCSSSSTPPTIPEDLSPPQAPTNLHSTLDEGTSRDWLAWDPSASANVAGYEVYSSSTPGGSGSLVGSVDANTDNYLLPIVGEATTEYYSVRAVGTNNVPSAFTATLTVDRSAWSGESTPTRPEKGTEGDF